ncbi:energy transducer TonB [Arenimonas sp.]|uniref:energy transducer TonB n=1 Tax=Arenimonas sp. TaxID=1872635 RepID=UPI0035AF3863
MVRSLPHPTPSSPFAGLDAKRIAGTTLALCVHAVVFGLLLVPTRWTPPEAKPRPQTTVVEMQPLPPPEITPTQAPPTPQPERRPQPVAQPQPQVQQAAAPDATPAFDTGEIEAPPAFDTGPAEESFDVGQPGLATLAYAFAPAPRYPRQAAIAGIEGTVLLKVLVDETGQPLEVAIERSSGDRRLDRAARDQVLQRWRFHPAQRGGRAIAAYALVPVEFRLP